MKSEVLRLIASGVLLCLIVAPVRGLAQEAGREEEREMPGDDLQQDIDRLKKQREKAVLEKELAEAQKATRDALRATASAPTLDDLDTAKKRAELEKAIAEAQKAALAARLPTPETKLLEGKTTADSGVVLEAHILAHQALKQVAQMVAADLKNRVGSNLVIHNERSLNTIWQFQAISLQTDDLNGRYEAIYSDTRVLSPLLAPYAASLVARSVLDVLGLFRSDVELSGKTFPLEENALVAAVAPLLAGNQTGVRIFYPALYLPPPLEASPFHSKLQQLAGKRSLAPKKLKELEETKDTHTADLLKALNDETDKLLASLAVVDKETGLTGLSSLLRAEALADKLTGDTDKVLFVKVLAAGGNNKITRNLVTLFTGSKLEHSGGAVVAYALFDKDGSIVTSGIAHKYGKYVEADRIPAS